MGLSGREAKLEKPLEGTWIHGRCGAGTVKMGLRLGAGHTGSRRHPNGNGAPPGLQESSGSGQKAGRILVTFLQGHGVVARGS